MTIGFPRNRSLRSVLIRFTKCAEEPVFRVHLKITPDGQRVSGVPLWKILAIQFHP